MSMRIVFMGTPAYAVQSLSALVEAGYDVVGVFTQPDRPRGRGGKVQQSPVKVYALDRGIPVFQPGRIRTEGVEALKSLAPDLCVTAAYGQILSEELLAIPRLGTVNVHASLLPKYRGSAPANWALINGEAVTGVTTMMTDKGIDTGDILLQRSTPVDPLEDAEQLVHRLGELGAALLVDTLRAMEQGACPRTPQDETAMSYHPMLRKALGQVDWALPAKDIVNLVRGLQPWPTAYTHSPHGTLKLLQALVEPGQGAAPGTVIEADGKKGLLVQAGEGAVRVLRLQGAGGKAMDANDYLRGRPMALGMVLGAAQTEGEPV